MVLVDAPFTAIGDDVTVDYDGQVRCHSFEEPCCVLGARAGFLRVARGHVTSP